MLSRFLSVVLLSLPLAAQVNRISNASAQVEMVGSASSLWRLTLIAGKRVHDFAPPVFELDGKQVKAELSGIHPIGSALDLGNGITERRFTGTFKGDSASSLELIFRLAANSPVVRFRYVLHCKTPQALTRSGTADNLTYLQAGFANLPRVTEVQLSDFNELLHSYTPSEREVTQAGFDDGLGLMGPLLVGEDRAGNTLLLAYEHGSTAPDAFLRFRLGRSRTASMEAVKGNYNPGQKISEFSSVWMDAAAGSGGLDGAAKDFRTFVLRYLNPKPESRKPYIFYNTWNYQERNRWWNGKPYLSSMNAERMLAEIDVAHRMGIEVFVLDTGWYEKTGDWRVSSARFPGGLEPIRQRLDSYGMKLGLWFGPTSAAKSSAMYLQHTGDVMSRNGVEGKPRPIWETEESYPMCLVSAYADAFAEELIRIAGVYGVRYFKWDAVGQYGCDSSNHLHGTAQNTLEERADSYAFQLPLAMAKVVQKLTAAYPDAIVDFDVTETGRAFGLGFLSAGKYFLINNGPYLANYDQLGPMNDRNVNLFFYPGPARTWICRSPLTYDRWIPSVLLLTHYLPDDPQSSQLTGLGSLILGQNGIWGDLLNVSPHGVELFSTVLGKYKQVRDDMAASFPVRSGAVGTTPEIHEKISEETGRGAVVLFAHGPGGNIRYVTHGKADTKWWGTEGTQVSYDSAGRAIIQCAGRSGTAIVFFGVR